VKEIVFVQKVQAP